MTTPAPLPGFHGLVGQSPPMQALFRRIAALAAVDVPLLILGESGTGKELVARALHAGSARRGAPFAPVNCGGLHRDLLRSELFGHEKGAFTGALGAHPGVLRRAHGGTVFLDEIGELAPEAQAALLRCLESGEVQPVGAATATRVDVRVLAATHRDLGALIRAGAFREDLYYRLRGAILRVPPLRARPDDLPLLVEAVRRAVVARHGGPAPRLTPAAARWLAAHPWPGNVRQLAALLREAWLLARDGTVDVADLAGLEDLAPAEGAAEAPGSDRPVPTTAGAPSPPPADRRETALALAADPGGVTSGQLARACGISGEWARRELVALTRAHCLRREGAGRATRYLRP